ncbi:delta3,5-delta2,4-dienoyl- isomerase precursor ech1 [Trichoderma arundinaceum]|uniref:Delta3,5-delta2,4-dienoyl-isomerase ech1 n=1 Tax=Trichoderma arundinaceum TaxID=490622 RepID=A0A395NUQ3_TRIAR|nr:delta3,5-delta2,4-dienoyl- isomerase precursor ech1 [Trichoderma arundinaceum]
MASSSSPSGAGSPLAAYASYKHFTVSSPKPFVAHVQIQRPEKLNAFTEAMWLEFGSVFRQLSADADVQAVVLSGAGDRAFTAGLDVQSAAQDGTFTAKDLDPARKAKKLRAQIDEFQSSIGAMEKCEKPVICAIHGIALGLAVDISCCADIRICASNTRFAVKEVDIGMAADIGTLARLPKIVGSVSWVKDVCLTARDFSAQEALAAGFVSQVHEGKEKTVQAALDLATTLAEKSPVAVQGTKELLNHARDHSTADNLRYTQLWNSVAVQGADFSSAILSVLKKQKPRYAKL